VATQQGRFAYTVLDELGEKLTFDFHVLLDDTVNLGTILASLGGTATEVDNITGGQITRTRLVVDVPPAGLKGAPVAGSRVEQNALFNVTNTVNQGHYAQNVPSLNDTMIVAGKVNLADANIIAFITGLTTAFGGGQFSNPAYQPISGLADVSLAFRRRRHQLSRISMEGP
jgi:hypothetical protein